MVIEIEQHEDVCVLRCKGRFVSGTDLEYVRDTIDQLKRQKCNRVLADFREVSAIGSMGLTFIVAIYTSVVNSGGRFVLAGALPFVRHALDLTRLSTVVSLAADAASGLAALRAE